MCGIYGYATHYKAKLSKEEMEERRKIAFGLGVAMQARGTDSSGLAFVNSGECLIVKAAESALSLLESEKAKKAFANNAPILLGHTRFATVGAISKKNAHPFRRGDIVGVHNGGVSNYLTLGHKVEVDSEVIFEELRKHKNDYKKAFAKLSGDFAIAWCSLKERSLYLVKSGNPIALAYVPRLKTLFWCSEERFLSPVLCAVLGEVGYSLVPLDDDRVYRIGQDLKQTSKKVSFASKPLIHYSKAYATGGEYGAGRWYDSYYEEDDDYRESGEIKCSLCGLPLSLKADKVYADDYEELYCLDCKKDYQNEVNFSEVSLK